MSERAILLRGRIVSSTAVAIVERIIDLSRQATDDILLCIDCVGGDVKAGLAIYEAMQLSPCDVATLCLGTAKSMATLLLASGATRKRFSMSNARISVHNPIMPAGKSRDNHSLDLMIALKDTLDATMLRHCRYSWRQLRRAQGNALSFTAMTAIELGLIDEILTIRSR